ncbi:adenosylmethionine-8-amino-7-oxononanoate aminotransferase [Bradyrhizobium sp. USDA 4449]
MEGAPFRFEPASDGIYIAPPMVITTDQVDWALEHFATT